MELGPRVASGATADVYALRDGWVLKLFETGTARETVEREAENTRIAATTGTPVPAVREVVRVNDRHGIVLSRVTGSLVVDGIGARPWRVVGDARRFARLHASIHARPAPSLPPLRERLADRIDDGPLTPAACEYLTTRLDALPAGDALCHGDFHPANVFRTTDGPVVIDWLDATNGHPATDVARTLLLVRFGALPSETVRRAVDCPLRTLFERAYRREYCSETGVTLAAIHAWELPVAAARLAEDAADDRLREWVADRLQRANIPAFTAGGR